MHSFDFTRLAILDNIELFSSENEQHYFPFHFHDYYCVSLITNGTELLHNTRQEFIAPAGTISITQANEVHRNYALSEAGYPVFIGICKKQQFYTSTFLPISLSLYA